MVPGIIILAAVCIIFFVLARQADRRRQGAGPGGTCEYRTAHPIDHCIDFLAHKNVNDLFDYTCQRQPNGVFLLHLTLHRPTRQPVDTLFYLRLDPGSQTVVTLSFVREAFGEKQPVFPQEVLDAFMQQKLDAHRTF